MDMEDRYVVCVSRHTPPGVTAGTREERARLAGVVVHPTGQAFQDTLGSPGRERLPGHGRYGKTGPHRKVTDT
jgi:hypothetical protein